MSRTVMITLLAASLGAVGCSDDKGGNSASSVDVGHDAATARDAAEGRDDAGVDAEPDASSGCLQANISGDWELTLNDDVSIEYSALVSPEIEGDERVLSLLFERYSPGPDVGTFDLSEEPDSNFGTCAHCVFIRTDGPERAYYVERGILENRKDPYGRRPDFSVTGLKLIEVEVDQMTRSSTPVPGGRCIEIADFEGSGVFPPSGWSCPDEAYNDDTECNCDCGAIDSDCGLQNDCLPGDPACPEPVDLPVVGCDAGEVCAFEPQGFANACIESCDWNAREGCSNGTCVYDFGVGDGDLCISNALRVASGVGLGETCPDTGFQVVCNVVGGFAEGYCGPNDVCRPICTSNEECTEPGEECRSFTFEDPRGYCGPDPFDG